MAAYAGKLASERALPWFADNERHAIPDELAQTILLRPACEKVSAAKPGCSPTRRRSETRVTVKKFSSSLLSSDVHNEVTECAECVYTFIGDIHVRAVTLFIRLDPPIFEQGRDDFIVQNSILGGFVITVLPNER